MRPEAKAATAGQSDRPELVAVLRREIEAGGPMRLARYMELCTAHYYGRGTAIGRSGDFVTAPEISQIFGELLGLWAAVVWRQMGAPSHVRLIELGPGNGTLMRDVLRAARIVPGFLAAAHVHLVETSAALAERQRNALAPHAAPMTWHRRLDDVPSGPTILLANELVDALPVDQLVRTGGTWSWRTIGLDTSGGLAFGTTAAVDADLDQAAQRLGRPLPATAPDGAIVTLGQYEALAEAIARRAREALLAALIIDYGHVEAGTGDTLQAVWRHAYEDPLAAPGEADLTAHVDFTALIAALQRAGGSSLAVDGPATQAALLASLGIAERASRLMAANPREANAIEMAVGRLLSPTGMGTLFKALGVRSAGLDPLPGLAAPSGPAPAGGAQAR